MQRPRSKNTRHANAEEKRFMGHTKESDCIVCGASAPSIVHHCKGSTFKHNKVLIGHWFVIPLCLGCDDVATRHGITNFIKEFEPQGELWERHVDGSSFNPPEDVRAAIANYKEYEYAKI